MRTKRTRTDFLLFPKIIREALPHLLRGRLFNCRLSRQANRALVQGEEGQYTDANPWELLAQPNNHKAEEHRLLAAEYAKTALKRDVNCTHGYSELVAAMGGRCADWCASNHYRLIQWLEGFLADHMDSWSGIMWLPDQLLDGQWFEERAPGATGFPRWTTPSAHRCTGVSFAGMRGSGKGYENLGADAAGIF